MTQPPRTAEAVVESLCTPASFGEQLLGDLAESFSLRVDRDGELRARRWYYREAMRCTVYLLLAWIRGIRLSDGKRLGGVVVSSYVFSMMLARFAITVVSSAGDLVGVASIGTLGNSPPTLFPIWFWIPFGAAYAVLAGYIAAWLNEEEPFATALALGVVWTCTLIAAQVLSSSQNISWWLTGLALVLTITGPVTGGILRIRHQALS